jgi:hypothetical protein
MTIARARKEWTPESAVAYAAEVKNRLWAPRRPVPHVIAPITAPPDIYKSPIGPIRVVFTRDFIKVATPGAEFEARQLAGFDEMDSRELLAYVCRVRKTPRNEVLSGRREAVIVTVRHEVMWMLKTYTSLSLPEIGRRMGGRDHTTVLHAVRKYQRLLEAGRVTPLEFNREIAVAVSRPRLAPVKD